MYIDINNMYLPYDYVSGLVDGEGCFSLNYRLDLKKNRPKSPRYFRWHATFAVVLRNDDLPLLQSLKDTLTCGSISCTKNACRYQVENTFDLYCKIVPFFTEHSLYGKKAEDFRLWAEAVSILSRQIKIKTNLVKGKRGFQKTIWEAKELDRLKEILYAMRQFKSKGTDSKWI